MIDRLNTIIRLAFDISEEAKQLKDDLLRNKNGELVMMVRNPQSVMGEIAIKADIIKANAQ